MSNISDIHRGLFADRVGGVEPKVTEESGDAKDYDQGFG